MKRFLWISCAAALIEIAAIASYALVMNDSGHTAYEPFATYGFFIPLLFIAAVSRIIWRDDRLMKRAAVAALSVAFTGIALVVALDTTNYLVQYDRWLKRGMPERGRITWLK